MEMASEATALEAISMFRCARDTDISDFLLHDAARYEKAGKERTYLLLDDELIHNDVLALLGFYTIAIQMLKIPEGSSKSRIKKLDGMFTQRNGEQISVIPAFLIGQLAKNDLYASAVTGSVIMEYALATIKKAQGLVGGRVVYLDCKREPKLVDFYNRNGFTLFNDDFNLPLIQMYCMI